MLLFMYLIFLEDALECKAGKYKVDGQCCSPCHAGFKVNETCNMMGITICVPCDPETYTSQHSGLKECLQCKVCHPEFGLVTRRKCSSTTNTVCSCSAGYFCTDMKYDDCQKCVAHQVCSPGQYVKSRGTEINNTICEKCPVGTFSPYGTLNQCLPWTNCTAQGLFEEKPGMDTTDAVCSPQSNPQHIKYKSTYPSFPSSSLPSLPSFIVHCVELLLLGSGAESSALCSEFKELPSFTSSILVPPLEMELELELEEVKAPHHGETSDLTEADGSVNNMPVQETRQEEESAPLRERMSEIVPNSP
ncbi:LOW QUALITY PROTEIN: tumor necrosis factor receptor superfamily member 14-like [Dromiciops gliroides]|uniref:LOW QUALITY PROTEIN: tumor necrosis factor receptor superfamily member 14-like n=1 Tax=Dromiciops gliroides TaxID=33562 RepID=UPI001CC4C7CB|nr:LOW QUALITY PROTEIN: tumor necrosis factor receptor superfamily member 14-like [Dromiciops gliroides]